jgi:uncharacterized protein
VTYLLDVNALLALGFRTHIHHDRVAAWIELKKAEAEFTLATCSITELAFVRIATGVAALSVDVPTAKSELAELKVNAAGRFVFFDDDLGVAQLPAWVVRSAQTTDGHLASLADARGAKLATFDKAIPGAELIS